MSGRKYLCSPNNDMVILFDNVFGANYTRAVVSGETLKDDKWVQPFFTSRTDALIFQQLIIERLSIEETPADKLETQLMTGDTGYSISLAILLKLRADLEDFLGGSAEAMTVEGQSSTLSLCGIGFAGVPLMYNGFNQAMTARDLAHYIDALNIKARDGLHIDVASNSSAAQIYYVFKNMGDMRNGISMHDKKNLLPALIGTQDSLAGALYKELNQSDSDLQHSYTKTDVYGYFFPFLTQGIDAYDIDKENGKLRAWKTPSMAALVPVSTLDEKYYQQVPVRRSLTKFKITGGA